MLNPLPTLPPLQFQEISHAYSVLSDADKRKKYDLYGEDEDFGDAGEECTLLPPPSNRSLSWQCQNLRLFVP